MKVTLRKSDHRVKTLLNKVEENENKISAQTEMIDVYIISNAQNHGIDIYMPLRSTKYKDTILIKL